MIDGKPTSISLSGKLFGEAQLVRLASEIQEHTQWDDLHPAWLMK
jgi:Asp-tRNA(Asn)/Glu-tRNA(Gln) amidotransferase A subunit family amidase